MDELYYTGNEKDAEVRLAVRDFLKLVRYEVFLDFLTVYFILLIHKLVINNGIYKVLNVECEWGDCKVTWYTLAFQLTRPVIYIIYSVKYLYTYVVYNIQEKESFLQKFILTWLAIDLLQPIPSTFWWRVNVCCWTTCCKAETWISRTLPKHFPYHGLCWMWKMQIVGEIAGNILILGVEQWILKKWRGCFLKKLSFNIIK